MADFGLLPTLPLDAAAELLRQPRQPRPLTDDFYQAQYRVDVDKDIEQTQAELPDFFRETAQKLAESESIRQRQQSAFAQRRAAMAGQGQMPTPLQPEDDIMAQAAARNAAQAQYEQQQAFLEQQMAQVQPPTRPPVEDEDTEGSGFFGQIFGGAKKVVKGAADVTAGLTGSASDAMLSLVEFPFEATREVVTGGGVRGVRREAGEAVAPIREPIEGIVEISRALLHRNLNEARQEFGEAWNEVPFARRIRQSWNGLNEILEGEQDIFTPVTRPIIRETLQAFQVPDDVADTISKYAAEVLVPTTFLPFQGGLIAKGLSKGRVVTTLLAEGTVNMLQNRAGHESRGEPSPSLEEDLLMFSGGVAGRGVAEMVGAKLGPVARNFLSRETGAATEQVIESGAETVARADVATPVRRISQVESVALPRGDDIVYSSLSPQAIREIEAGSRVKPIWTVPNPDDVKVTGLDDAGVVAFRRVEGVPGKRVGQIKDASVFQPNELEPLARIPESSIFPEDVIARARPISATPTETGLERVEQLPTVEPPVVPGRPRVRLSSERGAAKIPGEPPSERVPERVPEPTEPTPPEPVGEAGQVGEVVRRSNFSAVVRQPDGQYDVYDLRWADPKTGNVTTGVPRESAIHRYAEEDKARNFAELIDAAQGKRAPKTEVVSEAERVAAETPREVEVEPATRSIIEAGQAAAGVEEAQRTYQPAVESTVRDRGTTIEPHTGTAVPYEGYFVGGGVPTKKVSVEQFTARDIDDFVSENRAAFDADPNLKVGTEVVTENGKDVVNIDASISVADKDTALRLASERGEERVWSAADDQAIDVPKTSAPTPTPTPAHPKRIVEHPARPIADELREFADTWSKNEQHLAREVTSESSSGRGISRTIATHAKSVMGRIAKTVKTLGRKLHSSELGALRLGTRTDVEKLTYNDVMNYGTARRWLFPNESWDEWADRMAEVVGGKRPFWASAKDDVAQHLERQYGLVEGPVGGGQRVRRPEGVVTEPSFGPEAKPTTYDEFLRLFNEGRVVHSGGDRQDMTKWYSDFYGWAQKNFGDDADTFVALAASTQANASPSSGVVSTFRAYIQWRLGQPISGMPSSSVAQQMERVIRGANPAGPKITPFWEALRFHGLRGRNAVAIDRWMLASMGLPERAWKRAASNTKFMDFAQAVVRSAAREAGVSPRAFQAAVWAGTKKEWNGLRASLGVRPIGEDYRAFEKLFEEKLVEYGMRVPKNFQTLGRQQRLFDTDMLQNDVIGLMHRIPGEIIQQRGDRLNTLLYRSWNRDIAAAHLLDIGEVPTHITDPNIQAEVEHVASQYQRDFIERTHLATDKALTTMASPKSRLPSWQRRIVDETLDARRTGLQTHLESVKRLPTEERDRLRALGWDGLPQDPHVLGRVQQELDTLDSLKTVPELRRWLERNRDVTGDPSQWLGRKLKTGETYTGLSGKLTEKTKMSPYWEPKSFFETERILNIGRIKSEIRARFPDRRPVDGTAQPIGDIIKRGRSAPLGPCA